MDFHVYGITPIDFGWEHCPTVADYYSSLARNEFEGYTDIDILKQFKSDFETAKKLALDKGWEGDFRGAAHVFLVPTENEFSYGFAWKQDNNGTTYVISPVALAHLRRLEF